MDAPSLFQKIRRVQIQTSHLADDILAGAYRSAFKGKGMEFEEVREYIPGDEVRSIDWNVTARMNHPYVKSFREERELSVNLVVDISASTRFGTYNMSKGDLIAEIASVLAFSALKNHDKVGLIQFSETIEHYFPPKKGDRHVLRLVRELLTQRPSSAGTDMRQALFYLGKVQKRRGICFIISDFLCGDFSEALAPLAKRLDLIAIAVNDPHDMTLPDMGLASFRDLETNEEKLIDTSDPAVREAYALQAQKRLSDVQSLMGKMGGGFISIRSDENYLHILQKFFRLRELQWH